MLLSAVSVLVVAQTSSEIPEGLMNDPVLSFSLKNPSRPTPSKLLKRAPVKRDARLQGRVNLNFTFTQILKKSRRRLEMLGARS